MWVEILKWIVVMTFFVVMVSTFFPDRHTRLAVKEMRRRASALASRPSAITGATILEWGHDQVGVDDEGRPEYGPAYLVYEFRPETAGSARHTARHYILDTQAQRPDLAMLVGRIVGVRYAVGDPSLSLLDDIRL